MARPKTFFLLVTEPSFLLPLLLTVKIAVYVKIKLWYYCLTNTMVGKSKQALTECDAFLTARSSFEQILIEFQRPLSYLNTTKYYKYYYCSTVYAPSVVNYWICEFLQSVTTTRRRRRRTTTTTFKLIDRDARGEKFKFNAHIYGVHVLYSALVSTRFLNGNFTPQRNNNMRTINHYQH